MTPPRRSRAVVPMLALALLAAGCGKDEKADYRHQVADANAKFEGQLTDAGTKMRQAGQTKNRQLYSAGAMDLQTAVSAFNAKLEDLKEPSDARDEEQALIAALKRFSATVGRINAAVQSGDERAIRAEIATLQPQAQAVEAAGSALEKAVE